MALLTITSPPAPFLSNTLLPTHSPRSIDTCLPKVYLSTYHKTLEPIPMKQKTHAILLLSGSLATTSTPAAPAQEPAHRSTDLAITYASHETPAAASTHDSRTTIACVATASSIPRLCPPPSERRNPSHSQLLCAHCATPSSSSESSLAHPIACRGGIALRPSSIPTIPVQQYFHLSFPPACHSHAASSSPTLPSRFA